MTRDDRCHADRHELLAKLIVGRRWQNKQLTPTSEY